MADFGKLYDGRVIDLSPMSEGKAPLVWDGKGWVVFEGTVGQVGDSKPLTAEEAAALTSAG